MIILSNSLTGSADEGSLKLATSIVKRIKQKDRSTYIVSFEREYSESDAVLNLNKFHLSWALIKLLLRKKEKVLYIPFPAPTFSMALRIWILSRFARHGLKVMMIRQYPMNWAAEMLLRCSKAELVVFSEKALDFYHRIVGENVSYLKTGIETETFLPVSAEKAAKLKVKYGFDPEKPLVLHVGHMKSGRNIASLLDISDDFQILLVISTLSKERQDEELRKKLESKKNLRIFDQYIPNIEEIYQMCDVYFFPVEQAGHCIDVPLSCLEAASCNKPVVTTAFGEMTAFRKKDGFCFIDNFDSEYLDGLLKSAVRLPEPDIRSHVLEYDWSGSVERLIQDKA